MDLSELPNETVRSVLCETVAKCLNSNKYKIGLNSASKTGESNFIGIVYRATFSAENETENDNHPVHSLIVKVAPQDIKYRNMWYSRPCFLREIHMYNEVRIHRERSFHSARKKSSDLRCELNDLSRFRRIFYCFFFFGFICD